jgi:hypothetical protein
MNIVIINCTLTKKIANNFFSRIISNKHLKAVFVRASIEIKDNKKLTLEYWMLRRI